MFSCFCTSPPKKKELTTDHDHTKKESHISELSREEKSNKETSRDPDQKKRL